MKELSLSIGIALLVIVAAGGYEIHKSLQHLQAIQHKLITNNNKIIKSQEFAIKKMKAIYKEQQKIKKEQKDIKNQQLIIKKKITRPFTISSQSHNEFTVTLTNTIVAPIKYHELITFIEGLRKGDTLHFKLAGFGGRVSSLLALTEALQNTKAYVITHVIGDVYSAHAMLSCLGDQKIISDDITLMYHSASVGFGFQRYKVSDIIKQLGSLQLTLKKFMSKYCKPMVTDKEIQGILDGKDLYLKGSLVNKRLNK